MGGGGCCVMNCGFHPIRDIIDKFKRPSGACGYNPGPSLNEQHAKKIADELAEMKENIRKSYESSEAELMDYINDLTESLLRQLEGLNHRSFGGKQLNINIRGIREQNEELKNKRVKGHIARVMEDRLVLTDSELSVILEERDDKKRAKAFNSFVDRIYRDAILSLADQIETTTRFQSHFVEQEIEARLSEVSRSMKETEDAYTEILESRAAGEAQLAEKQMTYMYRVSLFDLLLDQLPSSENVR